MVVVTGGGGKGWVGSLEFWSWRFIEREKKISDTVDAQNFCFDGPCINPRTGWICMNGGVEPKTLHQVW